MFEVNVDASFKTRFKTLRKPSLSPSQSEGNIRSVGGSPAAVNELDQSFPEFIEHSHSHINCPNSVLRFFSPNINVQKFLDDLDIGLRVE